MQYRAQINIKYRKQRPNKGSKSNHFNSMIMSTVKFTIDKHFEITIINTIKAVVMNSALQFKLFIQ